MYTGDKDELYFIMSITQDNYANMLKRLDTKSKFSNFVLTYYSIALIVYAITGKFFPQIYNTLISDYFNIIISIVVLAYSISNSNANYQERKRNAENILNDVKGLKRELADSDIKVISESYQKITYGAEYRSDVDFFRTVKQRCKQLDIRWYLFKHDLNKIENNIEESKLKKYQKIANYLSEISPFFQQLKIICDYLLMLLILIMPVAIFAICILIP
ncbi:MAG: SLATT domain-containing protein [Lachnospiraceae bacterium]|nr:SLATT domain-containing protein [Lachnospiraceae bacterium]